MGVQEQGGGTCAVAWKFGNDQREQLAKGALSGQGSIPGGAWLLSCASMQGALCGSRVDPSVKGGKTCTVVVAMGV